MLFWASKYPRTLGMKESLAMILPYSPPCMANPGFPEWLLFTKHWNLSKKVNYVGQTLDYEQL